MKHELLAPAGSLKIFKAVLQAGADAIYLGGEKYGARAFAHNFSQEDLFEALDLAHGNGKKVHLTVNTLLKNREMGKELYDYIEPYYRHGFDAIIIQDYGVFTFLRENFPGLELHTSTQMSVANPAGAAYLKEQGANRLVLARELQLDEIRDIYDATQMEIECFIHGALCYCYSGQCLMSSMLGGRSGNRGRCAQPCRLAYDVIDDHNRPYHPKEKYPLSPKDLCGLQTLPSMCEAGIYSFKIEGRMKQLEYAAGVVSVYRKYLDLYERDPKNYRVDERDMEFLMQLGNRNGFTRGYYEMRNGRDMMTLTDSSHNSGQAGNVVIPDNRRPVPIEGTVVLYPDLPAAVYLNCGDLTVEVTGETVQEASKRPLSMTDVREKMEKTGDTPFEFSHLEITMADNCFMPVKQLNELRRRGLEQLQKMMFGPSDRPAPEQGMRLLTDLADRKQVSSKPACNVMVSTVEQLSAVMADEDIPMITLDICGEEALMGADFADALSYASFLTDAAARIRGAGKMAAYAFPHVFRKNTAAYFDSDEMREALKQFDHYYVRSFDSLGYAVNTLGVSGAQITLDHSLYVYSGETGAAYELSGIGHYTASVELNGKELKHMPNRNAEMLLYGYTPLMVSAQCVYKNYDHCMKKRQEKKFLKIKDRYLKEFFMKRNCKDCYNVIYNSQPLSLFHHRDQIEALQMETYRISFVTESADEVRRILGQYRKAFLQGQQIGASAEQNSYTNGHFKRGID